MTKDIRFFKQDGKWYADIPNHTLEENEMVMGTDNVLDIMSSGYNDVMIIVSDTLPDYMYLLKLSRTSHDDNGAWYNVYGNTIDVLGEVWICNVTHDIFGEHPENIYVINILNEDCFNREW
jgi:hypothetical protein